MTSSPPLLPGGRSDFAGAISYGEVVAVVAEGRREPWLVAGTRRKKGGTRWGRKEIRWWVGKGIVGSGEIR
jgi:hypothetical protein